MSLLNVLARRAHEEPERLAFSFPEQGPDATLTYAQLWASAQRVAAAVRERTTSGDRVLLLLRPGLTFITGFIGTLISGRIAVPGYPPDPLRWERSILRLNAIASDAKPALIVTEDAGDWLKAHADVPILALTGLPEAGNAPVLHAEPAYLQYTSGSTSTPRGVMISHDNLMANCAFARAQCGFSSASLLVSWVPPHHDQGLVYGICQPIVDGFPCILLSPRTFIEHPERWLELISTHRATHAGGPNFAYDVAVRKVPPSRRHGLDLSSWRCAYVAAEPVRAATLDRFAEAFAPCGFDRNSFQACYGLAEATLRVAASRLGTAPPVLHLDAASLSDGNVRGVPHTGPGVIDVVGHGKPRWPARRVVVVDPVTLQPQSEGRVGELWIEGPDVSSGYWRADDSTQTFGARTADGDGPFLRSGDLGFVMDDELFITGRLKDLIIVRGLNHYPHDVEETVERVLPLVRPGGVAAVGHEVAGEERLVVVAEIRAGSSSPSGDPSAAEGTGWEYQRMRAALQRRLADQHDLVLHDFVLVEPGSLPKTLSGKIQRGECGRRYRANQLSRARDAHGLIATQPLRLHANVGVEREERERGAVARVSIPGFETRMAKTAFQALVSTFADPKLPYFAAAESARTAAEFRWQMRQIHSYLEGGLLVPADDDVTLGDGRLMRPGITRWHRPDSKHLFFVYTGSARRLMMPPIDFLTQTGLISRNVVLFRDQLLDYYLSGISMEIPTLEALLGYQRGLVDASPDVTSTYCVGTSMGAFAAILAGHLLGVEAVWAFSPTQIRSSSHRRSKVSYDLPKLLGQSNGVTTYHIYYHDEHEDDAKHARELEGLPGVVLHPQAGSSHEVVQSLWRSGKLGRIFPGAEFIDRSKPAEPVHARPEIGVEMVLAAIRETVTATIDWTGASPLADHLDSFDTISLLARLETQLGVPIDYATLRSADLHTPASLAASLHRLLAAPATTDAAHANGSESSSSIRHAV